MTKPSRIAIVGCSANGYTDRVVRPIYPLCPIMALLATPKPDPLLVDRREAARLLSLSSRTIWTLTNAGVIPSVRIGRLVRYTLADLREFIDRQRSDGEA
jgi:excisionase family DNA binding protein